MAASSAIWVTRGLRFRRLLLCTSTSKFFCASISRTREFASKPRDGWRGLILWDRPGVEFLTLSQRSGRLLKEWIFVQLMASAQHSAGDSTFLYGKSGQEAAELLFSSEARPAIRLEPRGSCRALSEEDGQPRLLHLPWFPFAISAPALSRLVDGLDPALGRVAFCVDLHGHGRSCSGLAGGTGHGTGSGRGFRRALPVSVFVLDGQHARRLARGSNGDAIRRK